MFEPKYKRVLLKLSGEAISGKDGIIDFDFLDRIAATLVEISAAGVETAVVFGAGNIWRGRQGGGMNRVTADHMGMLATVINALAASDAVERAGGKAAVYTSTDMMPYAEYYSPERAQASLAEGRIVIFGGGTGCPYFSTDTAGMLRAIEIGADAFLLAKNVDGIYDSDPRKNPDAKLFDEIGYSDMVKRDLRGIDLTASAMGAEFGPPAVAFKLEDVADIKRAVEGKCGGTVIVRK